MIRYIGSTDSRFKTLTFVQGLNVILADRTERSSDRQSRNSSGKSSFVRLLHFLLGGNAGPNSFFRKEVLSSHTFVGGLELGERSVVIARSGAAPSTHLYSEAYPELPVLEAMRLVDDLVHDKVLLSDWERISLAQWRRRMADAYFGLPAELPRYSPSLRSLLSYFARRVGEGGFHTPFKHSFRQQQSDEQVAMSFLLDLDWAIAAEFENIRSEEKTFTSIRKAAKEGILGVGIGTTAELRTELAIARRRAERLHEQAAKFTVVDEYEEFEREADELTRQLRGLRNADAVDRDLLSDIKAAESSERAPGIGELDRLWAQANVVLPTHVRSTYEDVHRFHESVIRNRKLYLKREAEQAEERIRERQQESEQLDARRAQLMRLLSSGGALEQFAALEAEVSRAQTMVSELEQRYELAEKIEGGSTRLENRRMEQLLQLQGDHHDRVDRLAAAITRFSEFSQELYEERRGRLIVDATIHGPTFEVEIAGRGSVGIDSMQTLCFDLTIITLMQERGLGPGFLVHDSHIFDGVDERQVAGALSLGARLAEEYRFQYVITMNSDLVPAMRGGFDIEPYVNEVRLTDALEDGGLFGFRFD